MNSKALVWWTIVLALVAILSLAVAVLQYISGQRPALYAKIYYYPHYHLFRLNDTFGDERKIISEKSIFPENFEHVPFVSGVYRVLISNEGESVARDVNVNVARGVGALTLRAGKEKLTDGDRVSLGDIKPTDELELIAWTKYSSELRRRIEPDISITYDNGVVQIEKMYTIDGALRFIHKYNLHVLFVGFLWVVLVIASLAAAAASKRKSKSKEAAESTDNSDDKR